MKINKFFKNNSVYCIFCKRRRGVSDIVYSAGSTGVCRDCNLKLPLRSGGIYRRVTDGISDFAPFEYKGILRKAFLDYKFNGCRAYAPVFCYYICSVLEYDESVSNSSLCADTDIITSIPFSKERARERGYDQAELLARGISGHFGIPYNGALLERCKAVKRQSTLKALERAVNMNGAFTASPALVKDKSILLIDDICTTGATMRAAAKALLDAGALCVRPVTLAIDHLPEHSREYYTLMR